MEFRQAAADIEPPHHRGFFATRIGQWWSTYIDRGSRRFVSVPRGSRRKFFAAGLFIYGATHSTRAALVDADGRRRNLHRVFVKSRFPYLTLSAGNGGYKSLNIAMGFLRPDIERSLRIEDTARGEFVPVCRVAPVAVADVTEDLDQVAEKLDELTQDADLRGKGDLPILEQSLLQMAGKVPEHRRIRCLIQLYCLFGVNHRTAHKLLKDWTSDERENGTEEAAKAFHDQLRDITFPLALGRHGYNPSFLNLDLAQVESDLADLLETLAGWDVHPFLNSGTLLGYFRDGRPIPHDDDFDIGILLGGNTQDEVARNWHQFVAAVNERFNAIYKGSFLAVKLSNGVQVDLFPAWSIDGQLYVHPYCWADVSIDALLPLGKLTIRDREFPVPADPDRVLVVNYGPNWRVPDPFWRFDYKKSKQRFGKMLKKLKT
jgi:hypothetical protein